VLVRWVPAPSDAEVSAEIKRLGLADTRLEAVRTALVSASGAAAAGVLPDLSAERLTLPPGAAAGDVMTRLKASPLVRYCEPNYIRSALAPMAGGPNDFYYARGDLWWLEAVQSDKVWADSRFSGGSAVVIAIVDTGIMLSHEDLSARLVGGVNYVTTGGTADDDHGHGTHAAGLAAAAAGNSLGSAGVGMAAGVKLMPVKVLDENGDGNDFAIAQGVVWAASHGARVINLSLGGSAAGQVLKDAMDFAHDRGCVVVAAAGNSALKGNPVIYPAAYASVIAVAACDTAGAHAYYSEHGDYVDISAPGGGISQIADKAWAMLSTALPGRGDVYTLDGTFGSGYVAGSGELYAYLQGTSMAAPVVSGAAAMLLAQDPGRTPEEVENLLTTTAEKTGRETYADGWNAYQGWGRVNVYKALTRESTFAPKASGRATYNYPNPFKPELGEATFLVIPTDATAGAQVRIYDAVGNLVRSLELASAQAGAVVAWDGRNDRGEAVANGVYPYRLTVGGKTYANKIAVKN
jgi:subtilisin family serine protease